MDRRAVLVREPDRPEGESVDITPKDYAVRTLAQEYGGGAFSVSGDTLIFSNYKDQRLYKQSLSSNGIWCFPYHCLYTLVVFRILKQNCINV